MHSNKYPQREAGSASVSELRAAGNRQSYSVTYTVTDTEHGVEIVLLSVEKGKESIQGTLNVQRERVCV